jgi:hypothetical protein
MLCAVCLLPLPPPNCDRCKEVIDAEPLAIKARGILGVVYALTKRRAEALKVAKEALQLDPGFQLAQQIVDGKI